MTLAGDHSTAGAIIGGTLRHQGFKGLVRYACAGRGNVNITPAEVADLKANGIPVGIVVEHAADWLLEAPALTAQRFAGARDICRACGLPDGVIYAACDFDATNGGPTSPGSPGDQNMHRIIAGLQAAAATVGAGNVGFYGSYYAMEWLIPRAPWLRFYWQTLAWSHGHRHPAAALFQFATSTNVAGVQVDVDTILKANWGQRGVHPPAPAPKPKPPAPKRASGTFNFKGSYNHDAHTDHVVGEPGEVKEWGEVNETIWLKVGLNVGPKAGTGEWRDGGVLGATPR